MILNNIRGYSAALGVLVLSILVAGCSNVTAPKGSTDQKGLQNAAASKGGADQQGLQNSAVSKGSADQQGLQNAAASKGGADQQGLQNAAASKGGADQQGLKSPQNPGLQVPKSPQIQQSELTEQDILTAFSLVKGAVSASEAAQKISNTTHYEGGTTLTFTEKTVTAYDDKAGTFTVKVKGTKDNKPFEKAVTLTGFTHPYKDTSLSALTTSNVLVFDKAIEENMPLVAFINDANAAGGVGYASFSYVLSNGKTAELGKHPAYELTAHLKQVGTKIKVMADYKIVYKKLTEGGSETDESVFSSSIKISDSASYFTEDDVLEYVFKKTNDDFVMVDPSQFASYYYAQSKFSGTSIVRFDMKQIQKYVDLYKNKDLNKYLNFEIKPGINNPKNGGIKANDFTGELTVDYCIATADQVQNQSGIKCSRTVTKSGFKTIKTGDDIKRHFIFTVRLSSVRDANKIKKWQDKVLNGFRLFYVDENSQNPSGNLNNPFPEPGSEQNPYVLSLCDVGKSLLGSGNYGLSKDTNEKYIFIKHISLSKAKGSNELKVSMQLCGGETIDMTTKPFLGYGRKL